MRAEGEPPRASVDEVEAMERSLGTRLPAGYREFVTTLGVGLYGERVRVYAPSRIGNGLEAWRARVKAYWFWGDAPLSHADSQEAIVIADTVTADELVIHPRDPDAVLLLPRHSEKGRLLGRGFVAALGKLVRRDSVLRAFPVCAPPPPTEAPLPIPAPPESEVPWQPPAPRPPPSPEQRAWFMLEALVTDNRLERVKEVLREFPGILPRDPRASGALIKNALSGLSWRAGLGPSTPVEEASAKILADRALLDLLLAEGAAVNGAPGDVPPLHGAVGNGFADLLKVLLDHGADPRALDPAGKTASEYAKERLKKQRRPNAKAQHRAMLELLAAHETRTPR